MGIVGRLAKQRGKLEDPSYAFSNDWWDELFSGREQSDTGVVVNRESAMTVGAMYRAIDIVSTYIAKTPINPIIRKSKEIDETLPSYKLLKTEANDETLAFHFKQTLQHHAMSLGGGFAWIERDNAARPVKLIQLDPRRITPARVNGNLVYVYAMFGNADTGPGKNHRGCEYPVLWFDHFSVPW